MNVKIHATVGNIFKKNNAQNHEDHKHQCIICEKDFMYNQDLDAHVKEIHHVSSKENDLNVLMS